MGSWIEAPPSGGAFCCEVGSGAWAGELVFIEEDAVGGVGCGLDKAEAGLVDGGFYHFGVGAGFGCSGGEDGLEGDGFAGAVDLGCGEQGAFDAGAA